MRHFALLFILTLLSATLFAQKATVYGVLTDNFGTRVGQANVVVKNYGIGTSTGDDGSFTLQVPAEKPINIVITHQSFVPRRFTLTLAAGEERELNVEMEWTYVPLDTTLVKSPEKIRKEKIRDEAGGVAIEVKDVKYLPTPNMSFESALLAKANVGTVGGELSSSYVVRGGNFDENLVYVNGFQVYRPYLVRSGQQEGLSFINSDMVAKAYFSAGGFQPKYGDKMASVLDIEYKKPTKFAGSVMGSLLGASAHLEGAIRSKKDSLVKFTYLTGVRYRNNAYLLNSLETEGQYSPEFLDVQGFFTYRFNQKWELQYITNYALNRLSFTPVERETTFGTVNQVIRLEMFFEGSESDEYRTFMNGLALVHKPNDRLKLRLQASAYDATEREAFDILGEYFLGEVETDFSDDDFGQVRFGLGAGGLQDHARNQLDWTIINAAFRGEYQQNGHTLSFGVKYQREIIDDKINEWERLDSAGYSLPYSTEEVLLDRVLKSEFSLNSSRVSGYFQDSWLIVDNIRRLRFTYGGRFTWWDVNQEWVFSPRAQFSLKPATDKDIVFTFAAGMYNQPPFYREMRNLQGEVNLNLRAQKSIHLITGFDYNFELWERKFNFTTELYYKYLYDVVPYEFDNVLIRYFGENNATGYVVGADMRLSGEFVKGTDSYISLSFMSAREDIKDDFFYTYFDAEGNEVNPGVPGAPPAVDSTINYPGSIPRPTDQRVRFAMFFQDYIPGNENFKMHLNLVFATGLPFGPPDNQRYKDTFRVPAYRRVDIGFSALLFSKERMLEKGKRKGSFWENLENIWATFEVWNLLGVNNTVSYIWIKDVNNTTYAVPNFLSARRFNLRLRVEF